MRSAFLHFLRFVVQNIFPHLQFPKLLLHKLSLYLPLRISIAAQLPLQLQAIYPWIVCLHTICTRSNYMRPNLSFIYSCWVSLCAQSSSNNLSADYSRYFLQYNTYHLRYVKTSIWIYICREKKWKRSFIYF